MKLLLILLHILLLKIKIDTFLSYFFYINVISTPSYLLLEILSYTVINPYFLIRVNNNILLI